MCQNPISMFQSVLIGHFHQTRCCRIMHDHVGSWQDHVGSWRDHVGSRYGYQNPGRTRSARPPVPSSSAAWIGGSGARRPLLVLRTCGAAAAVLQPAPPAPLRRSSPLRPRSATTRRAGRAHTALRLAWAAAAQKQTYSPLLCSAAEEKPARGGQEPLAARPGGNRRTGQRGRRRGAFLWRTRAAAHTQQQASPCAQSSARAPRAAAATHEGPAGVTSINVSLLSSLPLVHAPPP